MDKVLLSDLKRKILIRSSLIALTSLDEILGLNDYLSPDEVLLEIIKKALREFELTVPLIHEMKLNKELMGTNYGMPGFLEIKNNFHLYLDGRIGEDLIVLVPNSIPLWRVGDTSYPSAGAYLWFSEYKRPYVFVDDMPSLTLFYCRGICSRPIVPDFMPDRSFNKDSDKAAIYWLNVEEGFRGLYFLDLCMVSLLDFIRQLKASIQLPNLSVDILGNVDSAYLELRSRCDLEMQQSGWYGELLI